MAEETPQNPSPAAGLPEEGPYGGDLGLSVDNGSTEVEQPAGTGAAEDVAGGEEGKTVVEPDEPDSEEFSFEDLYDRAPEAFKPEIKKVQSHFTRKSQKFAEERKRLEANQLTDDFKQGYGALYGWYEKIQKDPIGGIKALASEIGVAPEALVKSFQANNPPQEEELTPDKLETREDYVRYVAQELKKVREQEVKPLRETIERLSGNSESREYTERGMSAVENAVATIPGFAVEKDGKKVLSEDGRKALIAVAKYEFTGPDAIKNAFYSFSGRSAPAKIKDLESKLLSIKKNLTGAGNPPDVKQNRTTLAPSSPENLWDDLSKEPLTPG